MKLFQFTIFTIIAVAVSEPIPDILQLNSDLNVNLPTGVATGYSLYVKKGEYLASPHQFPHQVYYITSEGLICGGSIIRNNAILTAAHCVESALQVEIIPGAHHISKPEFPWQIRRSTLITRHPKYSPVTRVNDIAVIMVDMGFILDGTIIDSVAVYNGLDKLVEKNVSSSGWGWSGSKGGLVKSANTELRYIVGKTLKEKDCQNTFNGKKVTTVVCLEKVEGEGRCSIDAGGPLHLVQDNVLHVAGVFSFGADGKSICTKGKSTAFTAITKDMSQWIKDTVDGKKKSIF